MDDKRIETFEEAKELARELSPTFQSIIDNSSPALAATVLAILSYTVAMMIEGGFAMKKRYLDTINDLAKKMLNEGM